MLQRVFCVKGEIVFNFFKKKTTKFTITAPVPGILTNLDEVKDPVFSQKMMGDGFAISLSSTATSIFAPVAGKIVSLPESHHAVGIVTKDGDEILVHIGIDTVNLNGQGFSALVRQDEKITQGQELVRLDREFLKNKEVDLTTMVIFTKLIPEHQGWKMTKNYGGNVTTLDIIVEK